jgi:hypothetical protein
MIFIAAVHHCGYDGKVFNFCPWCGRELKKEECPELPTCLAEERLERNENTGYRIAAQLQELLGNSRFAQDNNKEEG